MYCNRGDTVLKVRWMIFSLGNESVFCGRGGGKNGFLTIPSP